MEVTKELAAKVLAVVDAGLSSGLGNPVPGEMCVEAAVCFAMDLPHGDTPSCVSPALRALKIELNDKAWSSNAARAKGLRRLAIAQLGSKDHIDEREWVRRVVEYTIRGSVPRALRAAAAIHPDEEQKLALEAAADKCEKEGTRSAESAAWSAESAAKSAESAAWSAAYDQSLSDFAEGIVQILIAMDAPGCKFLSLTE